MAFLKLGISREAAPHIAGGRVVLRQPKFSDYDAWSSLRRISQNFLSPWEPTWADNELTRGSYRKRILFYNSQWQNGTSFPLFIFARLDEEGARDALVGGLTLSNVRRGAAQSCTLGYWMGQPYAGRGLMTEAVTAVIPYVFDELELHRVEAACIPENSPSRKLLEKTGFQYEGMARRYLRIDGLWRDHLLYALLADDSRPQMMNQKN